jgi:probable HAF family extracellular repeat protein
MTAPSRTMLVAMCAVTLASMAHVGVVRAQDSLSSFDVPGALATRPFGISATGDIVGLYVNADGRTHGFLLRGETVTSIDVPGAIRTNAIGINSQGDVVGRYDTPDGRAHGYLWSAGAFTTIDFPGATFTTAAGVSPNCSGRGHSPISMFPAPLSRMRSQSTLPERSPAIIRAGRRFTATC